MVARASSGRRRGPRSEHDPLGLSVPTNGDHRERCRKQLQGVFRHKGGDFPAGRISTRKLVQHGRERDRGPRRPWGIAVSTVLPSKSSIAPAAEVVASFIEVHEQGRKLGRGPRRPEARSPRGMAVPMVSTARAAVGLSRGSKLPTARARSASSKHLRPVRARRRAACRGQHRFVEGVSVVPNA